MHYSKYIVIATFIGTLTAFIGPSSHASSIVYVSSRPEPEIVDAIKLNVTEESPELIEKPLPVEIVQPPATYIEAPIKNDVALAPLTTSFFNVPFYSQFNDISSEKWKGVGCGIASLAMIIEYYEPGEISVDDLLSEGILSGAYLNNAGWIHQGLADLAISHGLKGKPRDLSSQSMDSAFAQFIKSLQEGPAIASVHYTFEPTNPIPHLVVISGIDGDTVYYNDPSEPSGGGTISAEKFKKSWKKRFIEVHSAV